MNEFIGNITDGTFGGGTVFFIIAVLGLVILLFSFFLDGIFEIFDFGDGPLSLTTMSAFATVFGFSGIVALSLGASVPVAVAAGAAIGLLGGLGAWALSNSLKNSDSTSSVSTETLNDQLATVILNIPAKGVGEIAFSRHGLRHTFAAYSDEPISIGEKVRIIHALSGSSVQVERDVINIQTED
jgi:membrane protein implicated in regulation of membrane protease activity